MKKITVFSALVFALTFAQFARADFNIDAKKGAIKCTGNDVELKINAQRTEITIHWAGNEGGNEGYDVTDRQSDGDTFVSYTGGKNDVVLSFSDRGDSLELPQTKESYDLKCGK